MPRCPKCGAEIYSLYEYTDGEIRRTISLGEDRKVRWVNKVYLLNDIPVTKYECLKCQQVICNDEDVAVALLRGEEIIPLEEPVLVVAERRFFPVIQTCREEVAMMFAPEFREEKMAGLDDAAIEGIARKTGDRLMDMGYWEALEAVANGW